MFGSSFVGGLVLNKFLLGFFHKQIYIYEEKYEKLIGDTYLSLKNAKHWEPTR